MFVEEIKKIKKLEKENKDKIEQAQQKQQALIADALKGKEIELVRIKNEFAQKKEEAIFETKKRAEKQAKEIEERAKRDAQEIKLKVQDKIEKSINYLLKKL